MCYILYMQRAKILMMQSSYSFNNNCRISFYGHQLCFIPERCISIFAVSIVVYTCLLYSTYNFSPKFKTFSIVLKTITWKKLTLHYLYIHISEIYMLILYYKKIRHYGRYLILTKRYLFSLQLFYFNICLGLVQIHLFIK